MNNRYVKVPFIRISPNQVITYTILDPRPWREQPDKKLSNSDIAPTVKYSGLLTQSSKKKLIKAINLLVAIALPKKAMHFDSKKEFTFRVNFITLTLPADQLNVTDKELKEKCLKPWIEKWKDKNKGMSYVWRAERQSNNNLHFHIVTDRYIHYREIRDSWNNLLSNFHFINSFESKIGHRFPNSTDVHAVKKIRNLGAYISKYMSKKEKEGKPVDGKVWDCSKNLKSKDSCSFIASNESFDVFNYLYSIMPDSCFETDFCSGFKISERLMHEHFPASWVNEYKAYLNRVRELAIITYSKIKD